MDKKAVNVIAGGVNYFPFYPTNNTIDELDKLLAPFKENDGYSVNLKLISVILSKTNSDGYDWDSKRFIDFINSFLADNPTRQGKLIIRRERDIAKGTGTLLSPNDRLLGANYPNDVVLTMYKVTGSKGWGDKKLWIPNIKLPDETVYYDVDN